MSTIDQAKIRESPPAKGRRPNNWATLPTRRTGGKEYGGEGKAMERNNPLPPIPQLPSQHRRQ